MLNHLRTAWHSNHGTYLLLLAALASCLMSVIWYFDLIPNIEMHRNEARPTKPGAVQRPPCLIVATISVAKRRANEPPLAGYLQILSPDTSLSDEMVPLFSREFQADENGSHIEVVSELPSGQYSAMVFLDLNRNGKLDFDTTGRAMEPLRFSHPATSQEFTHLNPGESSFVLEATQPVRLKFNFLLQTGVPTRAVPPP